MKKSASELKNKLRIELAAEINSLKILSLSKLVEKINSENICSSDFIVKKLLIISEYNLYFIAPILKLYCFAEGVFLNIKIITPASVESTLQSDLTNLQNFSPDIIYLAAGIEHVKYQNYIHEFDRWNMFWQICLNNFNATIYQSNLIDCSFRTFSNLELKINDSSSSYIKLLNKKISDHSTTGVHIFDVNYLAMYYGLKNWQSERDYDFSNTPVSHDYEKIYAEKLAKLICADLGKSKKCLILDLDNTLWGGVLGEDGPTGIVFGQETSLGRAFWRFQKYLLGLKNRGVLLAIASKNDIASVKECFSFRVDMVLKLSDFAEIQCHWGPKTESILNISKLLNIDLRYMAFVDDNPAERALINESLPDVYCINLDPDVAFYVRSVSEANLFEMVSLTDEDLFRTNSLLSNKNRDLAPTVAISYNDFLKNLAMFAEINHAKISDLKRIHQLIKKTNQFNFTNIQYSEIQLSKIINTGLNLFLTLKLTDKFGTHGLVSLVFGEKDAIDETVLNIKLWVMSCRVFNRGVEIELLKNMRLWALKNNIQLIRIQYYANSKNKLVEAFLKNTPIFNYKNTVSDSATWEINLKLFDDSILNTDHLQTFIKGHSSDAN